MKQNNTKAQTQYVINTNSSSNIVIDNSDGYVTISDQFVDFKKGQRIIHETGFIIVATEDLKVLIKTLKGLVR